MAAGEVRQRLSLSGVVTGRRRLVFTSNRDGALNLYATGADGDQRMERLTESFNWQIPYSWSADGRFIAYTQQEFAARANANYNTWILALRDALDPRWKR